MTHRSRLGKICCLGLLLAVIGPLAGQERKPEPKNEGPKILLANPLGIVPGVTAKITLRGLKLDTATEIRCQDAKPAIKILSKGKAAVPDKQEPSKIGDTQIELEITLPAETPAGMIALSAVTPTGESPPHKVFVTKDIPIIQEKEPNNGFRQAQPIQVPQIVDGSISQPQDVDVFRFSAKAGQIVSVEVLAARHGSALDATLTAYDAAGHELGSNDDDGSLDPRLAIVIPRDGDYYVAVADAHDQGGPAHIYRLQVRLVK